MLTAIGHYHFFLRVRPAVLKRLLDRAGITFLRAMLVDFIALASDVTAKILAESPVSLDNPQIPVLNRDITGHLLEQESVSLLTPPKLGLHTFDLGNIYGHFHYCNDFAALIADGRGLNKHAYFPAVQAPDCFFTSMTASVLQNLLHGTDLAFLRTVLVYLIAVTALKVTEVLPETFVCIDDSGVGSLNGEIAGHRVEVLPVGVFHHVSTMFPREVLDNIPSIHHASFQCKTLLIASITERLLQVFYVC
jgi:hypothetical protein